MKQPIRAFSIGLFTSGIIFLIIFLVFGEVNSKQKNLSEEEMITALEDGGYHVLTDSDYVSLSVDDDDQKQDGANNEETEENDDNHDSDHDEANDENNDEDDNDESTNDDDDDSEKTTTYTLTIDEGMASSDIGAALEDNDIIDHAEEFNRFLEEEGYELKVQIGSFDVDDDMDFEDIAATITK